MSLNERTPNQSAAKLEKKEVQKDYINLLHSITTKRKARTIKALLEHPKSTNELRAQVGCSNPADIILNLKKAGWKIYTERRPLLDRDGVTVKPGWYWLDDSQIDTARRALTEFKALHTDKAS